jgi:type VII secretion integral membrane protein EccD
MSLAAPPHRTGTGRLTRVTLAGPRHRIDLVLPSDEPIGLLLPEIVAMVGYTGTDASRGYQLSTVDGNALDPEASLHRAEIPDGALLRVDPLVEAPPAATVHDVTDEVVDDLARRPGRWNTAARTWAATVVCAAATVAAAVLATPEVPWVLILAAGLAVALAGVVVAVLGARPAGVAVFLAGMTTTVGAVGVGVADGPQRWALWTLVAAWTVVGLGTVTGHQRAGALGGGTVMAYLLAATGMLVLGVPADRIAAVMVVVSVGVLGLLPRAAMVTSGLTRLDDRRAGDEPVSRLSAAAAVDAAHRGLALSCIATAVSAALAGLVLVGAGTGWTVMLAALTAVALASRLRAFPLTVEVLSLIAAVAAIGAGLLWAWGRHAPNLWWGPVLAASGVAGLAVLLLVYQPPPHVRARARQYADRIEAVAVVALIPVAVGVFQVYPRLLDTF